MTHPKLNAGPVITWPKGWIECPLCHKHYVLKGRARPFYCKLIRED